MLPDVLCVCVTVKKDCTGPQPWVLKTAELDLKLQSRQWLFKSSGNINAEDRLEGAAAALLSPYLLAAEMQHHTTSSLLAYAEWSPIAGSY